MPGGGIGELAVTGVLPLDRRLDWYSAARTPALLPSWADWAELGVGGWLRREMRLMEPASSAPDRLPSWDDWAEPGVG